MKKELIICLVLIGLFFITPYILAADGVVVPSGGGFTNLTDCLKTNNNSYGDSCIFNYTSGALYSQYTLNQSYVFNITSATDYTTTYNHGVILLNNTYNLTIDCNNSLFIGLNGSAIYIQNSSNITIKNCRFYNYPVAAVYVNNSFNITLDNMIIYNSSLHGLYLEYVNNSFIKNINISSDKKTFLSAFCGLSEYYCSHTQIYLFNSQYNLFNNLTLLGIGFKATGNAGGSRGIYLKSQSNFNNFTNATLDKFNYDALTV